MSTQRKHDGGPVFPHTRWDRDSTGEMAPREQSEGMSLRDWFAGQVLAAIYANPRDDYAGTTREDRAVEAYRAADAMLEAREEATS